MRVGVICIPALLGLAVAACGQRAKDTGEGLPIINVGENVTTPATDPLAVAQLRLTRLSGDDEKAFFTPGGIVDIAGDTIILRDATPGAERLLIFSLTDGDYLGEISHRGEGPEEYRIIITAFVDRARQRVMIPSVERPRVNVYSLTDGAYVETLPSDSILVTSPEATGGGACINYIKEVSPEALTVLQFDINFSPIDTVSIPGFRGGEFTTLWSNSGTTGVFLKGDTLCALHPGNLKEIAVINTGNYAITQEKEQELFMTMLETDESVPELMKPYIMVRDVQFTENKMLLSLMHDMKKNTEIYDMADGTMLYRFGYDTLSKMNGMEVKDRNGNVFQAENIFAKDGKWYGIVEEGNDSSQPENNNYGIVVFEIK